MEMSQNRSTKVKKGDQVSALTPGGKRILEVVALADTRGPATFAQTLYIDHTPVVERENCTSEI